MNVLLLGLAVAILLAAAAGAIVILEWLRAGSR